MKRSSLSGPRAGFTLIELLAVLVIISILFAFVVNRMLRGEDVVKNEQSRQFLAQISASISEYELEKGDYPPSTFPSEMSDKPSKTNMGAEMLVFSLFGKDWEARELPDDRLVNSDGDRTKESISSFTSTEAFELADDWGNPIAYIHRRDYGKSVTYSTFDAATGEVHDTPVKAWINPVTGDPYNRTSYQLICAGEDGIFGTEDDVANFTPAE